MDAERRLELYRQNSDNFRGLNAQMWQIPIIGMTLTGGLWFGVSNVKGSPFFQMGLLALAFVGNVALVLVLFRLRFVMGAYLDWLDQHDAEGKIDGNGPRFWQRSGTVRTVFQVVLGTAAGISLALLITTGLHARSERTKEARVPFYERYARAMADEFEVPEFSMAYPGLQELLVRSPRLTILDVGSGSLRDATAMARMGHRVLVAWAAPSFGTMGDPKTASRHWSVRGTVPELPEVRGACRFDLILVNGEWAHVPDSQRGRFMERLLDLLRSDGSIYMGFRDGPEDGESSVYPAPVAQVARLALASGARVAASDVRPDLIGRAKVRWRDVWIRADRQGRCGDLSAAGVGLAQPRPLPAPRPTIPIEAQRLGSGRHAKCLCARTVDRMRTKRA